MESLSNLLLDPSQLTSKQIAQYDAALAAAISQNSELVNQEIAKFFFGEDSKIIIQCILTHTKDQFKKAELFQKFTEISSEKIEKVFWKAENPNFLAAKNAVSMFGNAFLFKDREVVFINKISSFISVLPLESQLPFAKLIESFFEYSKNPIEMVDSSDDLLKKASNTYSFIASKIINEISKVDSFDAVFSLLRCTSKALTAIVDAETIKTLFSEGEKSELKELVVKKLPENMYTLLISILIQNFQAHVDYAYQRAKAMCLSTKSTIDRVFGYTALGQLVRFIASNDDFLDLLIDSLFKDIDSSNHLITSTLRTIVNSIFKTKKKELAPICAHMMKKIEPLAWHSKLKTWLLPQLLPHIEAGFFDPSELITISQNLSDAPFVTKCITSYAVSEETCETILHACINFIKNCPITNNLPSLKPLLQPMFKVQPKFIANAFAEFEEITEKYQKIWIVFEACRSIVKSQWPIEKEKLMEYIQFGINCCNWDLRVTAFDIFMLSGSPQTPEEAKFLENNFDNLMFIDSPKHVSSVISTMSALIEGFSGGKNRFKPEIINPLMKAILDKLDMHLIPSAITSHRQYALDLNNIIISKFPELETRQHITCLVTLLLDPALQKQAKEIISKRIAASEETKAYVEKIDSKKAKEILFSKKDVQGDENLKVDAGLPASEEELLASLSRCLNDAISWEEQCVLLNKIAESLKTLTQIVKKETIEKIACDIFNLLMTTRKLGVTCQGQQDLIQIISYLDKETIERLSNQWTDSLLAILGNFDMENMRRSAGLPYLALTIIRVQPSDVMTITGSNYSRLIDALLSLITKTENATEATNALNVIRAVLTDKTTSPYAESILPNVYCAILNVCGRLGGWELVAAANLCLSACIRKSSKKGTQQTDWKYLTLEQFFAKMPMLRESIIKSLNANKHSIYIALTILSQFDSTEGDEELLKLCLSHIDDRDSRLKRVAARACNRVSSQEGRCKLFNILCTALNHKENELNIAINSYNYLQGVIDLMREISAEENFKFEGEFPVLNFAKIPPPIWNDIIIVLKQLGKQDLVPVFPIKSTDFVFDEASLMLMQPSAAERTDRELVAMAARVALVEQKYPDDFLSVIAESVVSGKSSIALQNTGLDLVAQKLTTNIPSAERIIPLIKEETRPQILSGLIHLLSLAETTNEQLLSLFDKFEANVFDLSEATTPVHVSIAEILPKLLFDTRALIIGARLVVDDVPKVRTLSASALSAFFKVDFIAEQQLFRIALQKVCKENKLLLVDASLKWIKLIDSKSSDKHGEQLTVFVDEFFFTREIAKLLGIIIPFNEQQVENVVDIRGPYKSALVGEIEHRFITK